MGVFHVFLIVQMLPNRVKRHKYLNGRKKTRHEISSVKKIVGKKFRHWQNNQSLFTEEFFV